MEDTTEKTTLQKLETWAVSLPDQAKGYGHDIVEWAKRTNAKIDFDKDGNPDLNELAQGASDKVKQAADYLSKQGHALYNELPKGVKNFAEQAGEFAEHNKVGIGGALVAGLLGMTLLQGGPITALLLAVVGFLAGNLLGDNSDNNLVNTVTKKVQGLMKGKSKELEMEPPAPETTVTPSEPEASKDPKALEDAAKKAGDVKPDGVSGGEDKKTGEQVAPNNVSAGQVAQNTR